jgi:hypothetical protein
MQSKFKAILFVFIALCGISYTSFVFAAGATKVIMAKSGKTVCYTEKINIESADLDGRLCVTQGMFAHDQYVFSVNNNVVVKAIDDVTTQGISGTYKNTQFFLKCTPEHQLPEEPGKEVLDAYQKLTPDLPLESVRAGYILLNTVETGRLCDISVNNQSVFSVSVKFE